MHFAMKISVFALFVGLAACARDPAPGAGHDAAAPADEGLPLVVVYKGPACGCCENWIEHLRAAGFPVEVRDTQDLGAIKTAAGVPADQGSCHTAQVRDYFVEGHVPADDVKRLLIEQPDIRGLTVPGMVQGSPGMEQGGAQQAYDVLAVARDGSTSVFAHHGD